jgi:hypothetical protein
VFNEELPRTAYAVHENQGAGELKRLAELLQHSLQISGITDQDVDSKPCEIFNQFDRTHSMLHINV